MQARSQIVPECTTCLLTLQPDQASFRVRSVWRCTHMTDSSVSNQAPGVQGGHAQQQQVGEHAHVLHPGSAHVKHIKHVTEMRTCNRSQISSHPTAAAQETPQRRSQLYLDQELRRRWFRSRSGLTGGRRSEVTDETHLQGAL